MHFCKYSMCVLFSTRREAFSHIFLTHSLSVQFAHFRFGLSLEWKKSPFFRVLVQMSKYMNSVRCQAGQTNEEKKCVRNMKIVLGWAFCHTFHREKFVALLLLVCEYHCLFHFYFVLWCNENIIFISPLTVCHVSWKMYNYFIAFYVLRMHSTFCDKHTTTAHRSQIGINTHTQTYSYTLPHARINKKQRWIDFIF